MPFRVIDNRHDKVGASSNHPLRSRSSIRLKHTHGLSKEPGSATRRGRGTHRGKIVTPELITTSVTPSLGSYRWSTPMTLTPIHLTARPTCQGSSGGIIPAKRALSAMKILQTTIRQRGVLCGILQYDWDEVTAICMPSIDNI